MPRSSALFLDELSVQEVQEARVRRWLKQEQFSGHACEIQIVYELFGCGRLCLKRLPVNTEYIVGVYYWDNGKENGNYYSIMGYI